MTNSSLLDFALRPLFFFPSLISASAQLFKQKKKEQKKEKRKKDKGKVSTSPNQIDLRSPDREPRLPNIAKRPTKPPLASPGMH